MRSHKLFLLNLLMDHLLNLISLEQCEVFRDVYIGFLIEVMHARRALMK